ncbi:hypothetical protein NG726_39450, partial [Pseudomonas sp. MOB-449]|nr:hypothetical protein [Pseudomonas sp. MOB-449]
LSRLLVAGCAWMIERRRAMLCAVLPLLATMAVLTFSVAIEDSGIAYFKEGSPVRVSDEFINRSHVAGTAPGWIAIDSKTPRG